MTEILDSTVVEQPQQTKLDSLKSFVRNHWEKPVTVSIWALIAAVMYGNYKYIQNKLPTNIPQTTIEQPKQEEMFPDDNSIITLPPMLKPESNELPPPKPIPQQEAVVPPKPFPIIIKAKPDKPKYRAAAPPKTIIEKQPPTEIYGLIKPSKNLGNSRKTHHQLDGEGSSITYFGLQDHVY